MASTRSRITPKRVVKPEELLLDVRKAHDPEVVRIYRDAARGDIGRFKMLPAQFQGQTVKVEALVRDFSAADAEICDSLGLPEGKTITSWEPTLDLSLFATGGIAEKLLNEKMDFKIRIVAKMLYGVVIKQVWEGEESRFRKSDQLGLLIESFEVISDTMA